MRLAGKLATAVVLVMLAVFALRAYQGAERQIEEIEARIRAGQFTIARALRPAVKAIWQYEGAARALSVLEFADERLRSSRLVRLRWMPLSPEGPGEDAALIGASDLERLRQDADATVVRVRGEELITYVGVAIGGRVVGALRVSEPLTAHRETIRAEVKGALLRSGYAALFSIVAVSGLGFVLVGRPMRLLVEKARRIGAGDLGRPLAIKQRDEIGELAGEMNQMCQRLTSAQQRLQEETLARIKAIEHLRHADRLTTVGTLASGIAHELGTPLNVVSGHAKMVASGEVAGPEVLESARTIAGQVDRIAQIIRQLLDFARRRSPERSCQAVAPLVDRTLALLRPMALRRQVSIALATQGQAVEAEVDAAQFEQALTNLIVNGIQAMPEGGRLDVSVCLASATPPADHGGAPGEYARVLVADEGGGIPLADLPASSSLSSPQKG